MDEDTQLFIEFMGLATDKVVTSVRENERTREQLLPVQRCIIVRAAIVLMTAYFLD